MKTRSAPEFVDAHVHLWDPRETPRAISPLLRAVRVPRWADWVAERIFPRPLRRFFGSSRFITRRYGLDELSADRGQTQGGFVHVEAGWSGDPVDETRWLEGLDAGEMGAGGTGADEMGAGGMGEGNARLAAIVARADLASDDVEGVLDAHLEASERVVGVRETLTWHRAPGVLCGAAAPQRMNDAAWRRGFLALAARKLVFEATVYSEQLESLAELAQAHPQQAIVLSHAGTPVGIAGAFEGVGRDAAERAEIDATWRAGMKRLARCPNVSVKISGLLMPCLGHGFEHREAPVGVDEVVAAIGPMVEFIVDTFGAERCMLASNFPVEKVSVSYEVLVAAYVQIMARRSPTERQALFAGTARRVFVRRAQARAQARAQGLGVDVLGAA